MDIGSKITSYDFITMMVPGSLLMIIFVPIPSKSGFGWAVFLIISYLVGLLLHRMKECVRSLNIDYYYLELRTVWNRNDKLAIEKARHNVLVRLGKKIPSSDYTNAYYRIMGKPIESSIKVLETQETFLRDMSFIIICYDVLFSFYCCLARCNVLSDFYELFPFVPKGCCAFVLFSLLYIFNLGARYYSQMKIFELVWEGSAFVEPNNECVGNLSVKVGLHRSDSIYIQPYRKRKKRSNTVHATRGKRHKGS